jgi:hypothetical protein
MIKVIHVLDSPAIIKPSEITALCLIHGTAKKPVFPTKVLLFQMVLLLPESQAHV